MIENKYGRLVVDMAVFTIGTVLTKLVQFLLLPLYTTYMTTETYGVAELTNNMSELLFPIVTLCIYEAAFRYAVGSKHSKEEIISASIKVLFLSALAGAVLAVCAKHIIGYEYAFYLYFILFAYSFRMLIAYYVRGKGLSKLFAVSGIINAIFLAIFSIVFLILLKWGVKGYLLAIAFSYLFSMLFLFFGACIYKEVRVVSSNKGVTKELLNYSMPLIFYNIGYWLTTMSGRYILLWNTNSSTAGVYAAVIKMAAVINMLQQAFYAAFQLNTSREYESDDKEQYFTNIFKLYAACILIFGSIILCLSPILAKLTLKNEFYSAKVYLPLILFVAIIDCLFCFFKTMYTTYKLTKRAVPSMIIGTVVNIIICFATVTSFGIWGICIASLFCYVSQAIYRIFDVRKFVTIHCNWIVIIPCVLLLVIQVLCLTTYSLPGLLVSCLITIIVVLYNLIFYKKELLQIMKRLSLKNK
ncbi:lipopolysaccharide biosynthesis protein [Lacrimispora sp.]|uniref:lipopolysaccharide biosynthesis protein n=1 Tax=Lacrimispora sp. TaxID=2719234 RepID=UPI002FDAD987